MIQAYQIPIVLVPNNPFVDLRDSDEEKEENSNELGDNSWGILKNYLLLLMVARMLLRISYFKQLTCKSQMKKT